MENSQDNLWYIPGELGFPINAAPYDEPGDDVPLQPFEAPATDNKWRRRPMRMAAQRAQMHHLSLGNTGEYRDNEVMRRIHSICENFSINDPESVYSLFVKRLNKRLKLERKSEKLELVTAVLYYIDRRTSNKNVSIRDVLAMLKEHSNPTAIKHFAKVTSAVCEELNIKLLPAVTDDNMVRDMIDELLIACSVTEELGANEQKKTPEKYIRAAKFMNAVMAADELVTQDPLREHVESNSSHSERLRKRGCSEDSTVVSCDGTAISSLQPRRRRKKSSHRIITQSPIYLRKFADLINDNYDLIIKYSIQLVSWVNECGYHERGDVLDASARLNFHCRKTLLASIIYTIMLMLGITAQQKFLIDVWKIVRSTFYKVYEMLFTFMGRMLTVKYRVIVNSRRLILNFLRNMMKNVDYAYVGQSSGILPYYQGPDYWHLQSISGYGVPLGYVTGHSMITSGMIEDAVYEVKYLHNIFGVNRPHDDRVSKDPEGSSGLESLFKIKKSPSKDSDIQTVYVDGCVQEAQEERDEEIVNKYEDSEIEGFGYDMQPEATNMEFEKPDNNTAFGVSGEYALPFEDINRLVMLLGEALDIVRKHRRKDLYRQPLDEEKLFRIVTYCLDACEVEDEFIIKCGCIKKDTVVNRYYAVHGKLGSRIQRQVFPVSQYGNSGAYTMAMMYTKAMFIATSK
ncbi:hypothetical protein BgAZ_202600 [Babesia gibsoni]|uniref:Uncharacterized protein n=1 Tax=Babesia gibsoni TaxID=33632 RepID=A0AAD8LJH5_BABGI|nr:hypothetical protein BgAZ_202600 [Babesia gibsoni]